MQVTLKPGQTLTVVCEAADQPTPTPEPVPAPNPVPTEQLVFEDKLTTDLSRWDVVTKAAKIVPFGPTGSPCLIVDQASFGWGGELQKRIPATRRIRLELDMFVPTSLDMSFGPGRHFFRLSDLQNPNGFGCEINHEIAGSSGEMQAQVFWPRENNFGPISGGKLPRSRWFAVSVTMDLNRGIGTYVVDGKVQVVAFPPPTDSRSIQTLRLVTNYDGAQPGQGAFYYRNVRVYKLD